MCDVVGCVWRECQGGGSAKVEGVSRVCVWRVLRGLCGDSVMCAGVNMCDLLPLTSCWAQVYQGRHHFVDRCYIQTHSPVSVYECLIGCERVRQEGEKEGEGRRGKRKERGGGEGKRKERGGGEGKRKERGGERGGGEGKRKERGGERGGGEGRKERREWRREGRKERGRGRNEHTLTHSLHTYIHHRSYPHSRE